MNDDIGISQNINISTDIREAIWKKCIFLRVSTNNVVFDSTVEKFGKGHE